MRRITIARGTRAAAVIATMAVAATASGGPARAAPSRSWVDGVWRANGYGMVISLGGSRGNAFQTTAISCLLAQQADQLGPPDRTGVVRFGVGGVTTTTVRPDGHNRALLHSLGSAGDIGPELYKILST